jgi:Na+/H+ antiporter NhaD/arsenite permease-like protein
MSIPVVSLIALLVAILISCFTPLNIGTLSIGLALLIGWLGDVKVATIVQGFPASLLLLLAGTTYLFSIAQTNGTLDKLARYAIAAVGGRPALLPLILFAFAFGLSALGPGQITTSALLAPGAMLIANQVGISPLLMALVVGNGAQAGAMSPLAPPGIISAGILAKQGLTGVGGVLWLNMFIVHLAVTVLAYLLFGGLRLWRQGGTLAGVEAAPAEAVVPFDRAQIATLAGIVALAAGALFLKLDIGFLAFLIGALLSLFKVVDEKQAIKAMPWNTILMVTGVTVLVNLMSKVGGIDLFATLIAKMSTVGTVTLVAGFWSGLVSAYASTTGVILPAFLPMAAPLLKQLGAPATDLLALASSIIVCGFVVDLSPLSTTGAVFIANAGAKADKNLLFRNMLIWGLSMSVVGALVSWVAFTVLRLP